MSDMKTKISILNQVKYRDSNVLHTLNNTLVLQFFTYCVKVWWNIYQSRINPLVILQKQPERIIHKIGFQYHS